MNKNDSNDEIARRYEAIANWPLLRKFETFIFAAMFLALPLLAFKVVEYTTTALAVKNSAVGLVGDLIRCKNMAKEHNVAITLKFRASPDNNAASTYEIRDEEKAVEEVTLPKGVTVIGSVVFSPDGRPSAPASFIITKNNRSSHIEVDAQGIITNVK